MALFSLFLLRTAAHGTFLSHLCIITMLSYGTFHSAVLSLLAYKNNALCIALVMRRKWYHVLEVCKMMCTELNAIFSLICSSHENFLIHAPMDMLKAVGSECKSFCIYFLKLSPIFEISLTRKTPSHSLCTVVG